MTQSITLGTIIEQKSEIRGGRPIVAGTGVTVQRIVGWYQKGLSAEQIAKEIPHLTLAQIHAALAYYHLNTAEIDDAIQSDVDFVAPI